MLFPDTNLQEEYTKILLDSDERFNLKCIRYYGEYFQDEEYNLNRGNYTVIMDNKLTASVTVFDNMFTEFNNFTDEHKTLYF